MRRFRLPALAALALGMLSLAAGSALAQGAKEQLVGSWSMVSLEVDMAGKKIQPFGPNPVGRMMLNADGTFSTIIMRPGLPHFASNNRMQGTPDEYRTILQGSNALFGSYTVDDAGKTVTFNVEFSTFPNWNGDAQKRDFTVTGDEFRYSNTTTLGSGSSVATWRRIK